MLLLLLLGGLDVACSQQYPTGEVFFQTLANTSQVDSSGSGLPFMGWLPPSYYSTDDLLPIVITLQGINECGAGTRWPLEKMSNYGALKHVRGGQSSTFEEHSAILVSPQVPWGWVYYNYNSSLVMDKFVSYLVRNFRVDEDRIYLAGMSMGGGGAWYYARDFGHRLAAFAVGSPNGDPRLNDLAVSYNNLANNSTASIWVHHAADDLSLDPCWWSTGLPTNRTYVAGDEGWTNGIAKAMGGGEERLLDVYPEEVVVTESNGIRLASGDPIPEDRTATYDREKGQWTWAAGRDFVAGHRLQMTMYKEGGHGQGYYAMWGDSEPNSVFWNWVFAQRRGESPTSSSSSNSSNDAAL